MEVFYGIVFLLSAMAVGILEWTKNSEGSSGNGSSGNGNRDFLKFRNNYVLVYALMMGEQLCNGLHMLGNNEPVTSNLPVCSW